MAEYDFPHVLNVSDEELLNRWKQTFSRHGSFPEDVKTEVVRRAILKLHRSSERLEKLTVVLIILTVILALLTLRPAVDVILRFVE